jgi:hypothetical protein
LVAQNIWQRNGCFLRTGSARRRDPIQTLSLCTLGLSPERDLDTLDRQP